MKSLAYGKQSIDSADIRGVVRVLRSDWLSQGPAIAEFESRIAQYCGSRYAVAVSSGTSALHLACITAGLKKGLNAVTTPVTFLATANAVAFTGAAPRFADIDYETVNIDPARIERQLDRYSRAILPVHFAGLPVSLDRIQKIARKRKCMVIEDACHALGAEYRGKKIGACEYSDMTVFSFHPVKHITMGEGGCITTNDKKIYKQLLSLRHHGITKDERQQKQYGSWYYEMRALGFNYRVTDFQCSLGITQLAKLNRFVHKRHAVAAAYNAAFESLEGSVLLPALQYPDRKHAWHLYLLRLLKGNAAQMTRNQLFEKLKKFGIHAQVHYMPVYRHPYYRKNFPVNFRSFPNTEKYFKETLSLPMFPAMTRQDIRRVVDAVHKILG